MTSYVLYTNCAADHKGALFGFCVVGNARMYFRDCAMFAHFSQKLTYIQCESARKFFTYTD